MSRPVTRPIRPAGFTLVELLVVIAIIGVMVAMMLPALMASREIGRRSQCQANLSQLMLALQAYDNAFGTLPAGVTNPDGPIRNEAQGLHQGWIIALLPYLDQPGAAALVDRSQSVYADANRSVRQFWPTELICPSEPDRLAGNSNYAGCHHDVEAPIDANNSGVLYLNSHVRREDITDGLSHVLGVSEKRARVDDLGWMSGTRATLRNTGTPPNDVGERAIANEPATEAKPLEFVGGFGSAHPNGVHAGMADASVHFVDDMIDAQVWSQLGNRADGKLLNVPALTP